MSDRRNRPTKVFAPRSCDVCGTEFVPDRKNAHCCSAKCLTKYHDRKTARSRRFYLQWKYGAPSITGWYWVMENACEKGIKWYSGGEVNWLCWAGPIQEPDR